MNLEALFGNDFFKGGIGVAIAGAIVVALKQLPMNLWQFVIRQLTVNVEICSDSPLFERTTSWLDSLPQTHRTRSLVAKANVSYTYQGSKDFGIILSPAPGFHILRINEKFVLITRFRQAVAGAPSAADAALTKQSETITFRYIGRTQSFGRLIVDLIMKHYDNKRFKTQTVCNFRPNIWSAHERQLRVMDSVVMPNGVGEGVESDMKRFLSAKREYNNLRIPYQRIYIFYGSPGSGKTSLISALAGQFGLTIYNLHLGKHIEPEDMLGNIPTKSIIVVEDIDSHYNGRQASPNSMEFSTFINMLDGFRAKEEAIVILTTNHLEKLDPAIIRRANMKVKFDLANEDQAIRLFLKFFPGNESSAKSFAKLGAGQMMSDLQSWLLANREDVNAASMYIPLPEKLS